MANSASYAVHNGSSTHYALEFEDGTFYYEGEACESGLDAVTKFIDSNKGKAGEALENKEDNLIDTFISKFNADSPGFI